MLSSQMFSFWLLLKLTDLSDSLYCNVAYKRQTSQSTVYYESDMINGYSCNAVDGSPIQEFYQGSCLHTKPEMTPWWQVDLGAVYTVDFINLSARTDGPEYFHYKKSGKLEITLSSSIDVNGNLLSPSVCVTNTPEPALSEIYSPITIQCTAPTTGRYLRITRQDSVSANLQICEVEIYTNIPSCPNPPESWTCRDLCYDQSTNLNVCPPTTEVTATSFGSTGRSMYTGNTSYTGCMCPCTSVGTYSYYNITDEELQKKIDEIINAIKIDVKETSLAKSKLKSAKDNRPSAKAVGSMGIIILILVFGVICAMDVNIYIKGIQLIKNIFTRKKS